MSSDSCFFLLLLKLMAVLTIGSSIIHLFLPQKEHQPVQDSVLGTGVDCNMGVHKTMLCVCGGGGQVTI